jgi:hypothetical protein
MYGERERERKREREREREREDVLSLASIVAVLTLFLCEMALGWQSPISRSCCFSQSGCFFMNILSSAIAFFTKSLQPEVSNTSAVDNKLSPEDNFWLPPERVPL